MKIQIKSAKPVVTLAATPKSIADCLGIDSLIIANLIIKCPVANTSVISIGDATAQLFTIEKGAVINVSSMSKSMGLDEIDLKDIFIKVGTNGDAAEILFSVRPVR